MAILETERNERIVKWSAVLEMAIECGNPYRLPFCSVLSVRFSSARRKAGQSKRRCHILGLKIVCPVTALHSVVATKC